MMEFELNCLVRYSSLSVNTRIIIILFTLDLTCVNHLDFNHVCLYLPVILSTTSVVMMLLSYNLVTSVCLK